MSMMEKISDILNQTEVKKMNLRKAMLTLLVEWNDLENHLELTQKCFQESYAEQTSRENHLRAVQESVTQSSNNLETIRKSLEKRFQEFEQKEKEFHLFQKNGIREMEFMEEKLGLIRKEVKMREERMNEQEKLIEKHLEEIEMERKRFEGMRKLVDEGVEEMSLKQKCVEYSLKGYGSMENRIEEHVKEIELKEKKLKAMEAELELTEKNLNSIRTAASQMVDACEEIVEHTRKVSEASGSDQCSQDGFPTSEALKHFTDVGEKVKTNEKLDKNINSAGVRNEEMPKVDAGKPRESREQRTKGRKRLRNSVLESSERSDNSSDHIRKNMKLKGSSYPEGRIPQMGKNQQAAGSIGTTANNVNFNQKTTSNSSISPFCKTKYQYEKKFLNSPLRCQRCSKPFIAYDLGVQGVPSGFNSVEGAQGVPPRSNRNLPQQKDIPHLGSSRTGTTNTAAYPASGMGLQGKANSSGVKLESGTATGSTTDVGGKVKTNENDDKGGVNEGEQRNKGEKRGQKQVVKSSDDSQSVADLDDPELADYLYFVSEFNDDSESDVALDDEPEPVVYECPEPEFNDFDKDKEESCFAVDQIWACYDDVDGMPRFYAQIKKVFKPGFKLRITWLEGIPEDQAGVDWVNNELPFGCGGFGHGNNDDVSDRLTFSHQMQCGKGKSRASIVIHPRKGEVWALFNDWDIKWSSNTEESKKFKYEIVEIVCDFVEDVGIRVAYLYKVEGFVSLFQRSNPNEIDSLLIPSDELLRFSHRIPSFTMSGTEKKGQKSVPKGSFELDAASLPINPGDICYPSS